MRFLADENVARFVVVSLQAMGADVVRVQEIAPAATDHKILQLAFEQQRVVLTHDLDFGDLLKFPAQEHAGVLLLRFKNQTPAHVSEYLLATLRSIEHQRWNGRLAVLNEYGVRWYSTKDE